MNASPSTSGATPRPSLKASTAALAAGATPSLAAADFKELL